MNILPITKLPLAEKLWFANEKICLLLKDGREISVPLSWYSRLANANSEQLNNYRFIGNGHGIHWEELDEDISVEGLLM